MNHLFGENQFAKLGCLQLVNVTVVPNFNDFFSTKQTFTCQPIGRQLGKKWPRTSLWIDLVLGERSRRRKVFHGHQMIMIRIHEVKGAAGNSGRIWSRVSDNQAMAGIFISFEGIDGAGKSSHLQALAETFRAGAPHKRQVLVTREPGGTALSERLREMVLHEPMDALTEAFLVFAARREHIVQVIAPALARGDVVLCDRFTDASFAYQGAGRRFDLETLSKLEHATQDICRLDTNLVSNITLSHGILQPSLTLLFEVPPAVAAQRLAAARDPDKFESQDLAFFERVVSGYAARIEADRKRFVRINGNQSIDHVRAEVMTAVRSRGYL